MLGQYRFQKPTFTLRLELCQIRGRIPALTAASIRGKSWDILSTVVLLDSAPDLSF